MHGVSNILLFATSVFLSINCVILSDLSSCYIILLSVAALRRVHLDLSSVPGEQLLSDDASQPAER